MFQIIQVIELGNHCANELCGDTPYCVVMDQNNLIGKYSMQFFLTWFEVVGIEGISSVKTVKLSVANCYLAIKIKMCLLGNGRKGTIY